MIILFVIMMFGARCVYSQNESIIASLLLRFGRRHETGPYCGAITFTVPALRGCMEIVDGAFNFSLSQQRRLPVRKFQFGNGDGVLHADILGYLLDRVPEWGGNWEHVCSRVGWLRPDLIAAEVHVHVAEPPLPPEEIIPNLERRIQDLEVCNAQMQGRVHLYHDRLDAANGKLRSLRQHVKRLEESLSKARGLNEGAMMMTMQSMLVLWWDCTKERHTVILASEGD